MAIKYLRKAEPKQLKGTALLRLDFNTEDNWRMEAAVPTIRFLLRTASKIVIVSHRGRPSGNDKKLSLRRDARNLQRFLGRQVIFAPYLSLSKTKEVISAAPRGSIFVLENIRFWRGEEANDPKFAKQLSSLADFYVNDAFAVSHRANASVSAITKFLPSYAGLEFEKEIAFLSKAIMNPRHPLVLILGGAKAADKLGVIKYFRNKADWFLLGGGPANTILSLEGMDVKNSLKAKDPKDLKDIKMIARYKNIVLPEDFKWHNEAIVDFGTKTIRKFNKKISEARTIVWSGPLGMIDKAPFGRGTLRMARAIVKNKKAFSVAGGGETVMFLKKYKLDGKFSFISTGGGAMVNYLAGETLPGIKALRKS